MEDNTMPTTKRLMALTNTALLHLRKAEATMEHPSISKGHMDIAKTAMEALQELAKAKRG
jgi:hypothetical protein